MNPSSTNPATPAAPNTQKVAVGLLVAEAMSKSNDANQKQLQSQKEVDQQFMEQSISKTIQQIINNAPDQQTALAEVKSFLGNLKADDSSWGTEIQSWISNELNTANSYSPPEDLVKQLSEDVQNVAQAQQDLEDSENTLNSDTAIKDADVDRMQAYEKAMANAPWYKKIEYALVIAGLGIAIGAMYVAIGLDQANVNNAKTTLSDVQRDLADDEQQLKNDPHIRGYLTEIAGNGNLIQQESSENISDYQSRVNFLEGFNKSMEGFIEEFTASSEVASAGGS